MKSVRSIVSGSSTAYSGTGDERGEACGELDFEAGLEALELLLDVLPFRVAVFLDLDRTMTSCEWLDDLMGMRVTWWRELLGFFFSLPALALELLSEES